MIPSRTPLVLSSLAALCLSGIASIAAPIVLNDIKAVVNGEPITQSMVDSAVRTQIQVWLMGNKGMVTKAQAEAEIREMEAKALDDLIDRTLIISEFESLGGNIKEQYIDEAVKRFIKDRFGGDKDKFLAELQESGMTIAQFREIQRDQIAIQALRSEHAGDEVIPNTPWEKKEGFDEMKDQWKTAGNPKVRIMSIPKAAEGKTQEQQKALLDDILSQLENGASFGALAKKYSADSFASKEGGGYVGVISRSGPLAEGLTGVAYSLPPGQMSKPLDDGAIWRIIKVDEMVGQSTPSYKDKEEEVDRLLTIQKKQRNLEAWLKTLRRDANVRIYGN